MSDPFYSNYYPPIFVSKHRHVFTPPTPRRKKDESSDGEPRVDVEDSGEPGANTAGS